MEEDARMKKMRELCLEMMDVLGAVQSMELMDILTAAHNNGYENQEPDAFPFEFWNAWDAALTEKY